MQIVHLMIDELLQQLQGIIKLDSWLFNLFRRKAVANQEGAVSLFFDQLLGSFQQGLWKAQAVVKTAAPLVLTDIGMGRDKLLD